MATGVLFNSPFIYELSDSGYSIYGAGVLDTMGANWVAANYRYISSSISSTTSSKSFTFNVTASDDRIRVALAFLKNAYISGSGHENFSATGYTLEDLDLRVYAPDGTEVASSTSGKNNIEIVDFVPTQTGTYTI